MQAAAVTSFSPNDPVQGLSLLEVPEPEPRTGWINVTVKASALNHHDLWSLRGIGLQATQLPMILGTDAAGETPDGRRVIVHGVIGSNDPYAAVFPQESRSLLSEKYPGSLAEIVQVPELNLVPLPAGLTFEEGACLPTAWLTAYRLVFSAAALTPGQSLLVQGASGGVASAAIALAAAAGITVYATSRTADSREFAIGQGADAAFEPGARLPHKVDAVIETVGAATWQHTLRSVRPGGVVAIAGATTGDAAPAGLSRIFFNEITVRGVTMGSTAELAKLVNFLIQTGLRPPIDSVVRLSDVGQGISKLAAGAQRGKIVVIP